MRIPISPGQDAVLPGFWAIRLSRTALRSRDAAGERVMLRASRADDGVVVASGGG